MQIQIDELTSHYGMSPNDYTAIRCGMNVSKAIIKGEIDAGIGLENVQMVELAESCAPGGTGTKADAVGAIRLCFEIMELMKLVSVSTYLAANAMWY